MDATDPQTIRTLWHDFCEDLKLAGDELARPSTPHDELTVAEGVRHLSRLVRMGLETNVELDDPDFPMIATVVDETRKFGCDNPDTVYQKSVLNGQHAYRISGHRGTVDYLSMTSMKPDTAGTVKTGFIDSHSLEIDPDGGFEIELSCAAPEGGGNWLRIEPDTHQLNIRQTFLDRKNEDLAALSIERIGVVGTPMPLALADIERRLTGASTFVRNVAHLFTNWTESYLAHPNQLPPADQAATQAAGGDPNIYFYRSFWELAPDEALLVHIPRVPKCDAWNLQVDNYWQESMDYRYHRSSINRGSASANSDGSVTAVIAHTDPGHPNWLDTAGHRLGHFAMRWIRADEHVDPITKSCKQSEIGTVLRALES
jgi:Protein of unknown function (DUF1214)